MAKEWSLPRIERGTSSRWVVIANALRRNHTTRPKARFGCCCEDGEQSAMSRIEAEREGKVSQYEVPAPRLILSLGSYCYDNAHGEINTTRPKALFGCCCEDGEQSAMSRIEAEREGKVSQYEVPAPRLRRRAYGASGPITNQFSTILVSCHCVVGAGRLCTFRPSKETMWLGCSFATRSSSRYLCQLRPVVGFAWGHRAGAHSRRSSSLRGERLARVIAGRYYFEGVRGDHTRLEVSLMRF